MGVRSFRLRKQPNASSLPFEENVLVIIRRENGNTLKPGPSLYIFLFLLSLYFLSFSTAWSNRNIGEGHVKIAVLQAIYAKGDIGLEDGNAYTMKGRNGKYFTWHDFGQNLFVFPFFVLLQPLRDTGFPFFIANAILTSLTCVLLYKVLTIFGYHHRASIITSLLYGIATEAWFYGAKVPFENPITTFTVFASFYFSLRYIEGAFKNIRYMLIAATFVGAGMMTRIDAILSILPLAILIYLGSKYNYKFSFPLKKVTFWFLLIITPFIAFALFYNYIRFESPFQTGYSLVLKKTFFKLIHIPFGITGFLFSPGKSIFLYSPILLLAPFAFREFYQKIPRYAFYAVISLITTYFLFYSSYVAWHGDWCWGPRYLLVITPYIVLPLASLFEKWENHTRFLKITTLCIIISSIFVQMIPVVSNFYIDLAMKYGFHSLDYPELQKHYGPIDSFSYWTSFFQIKYGSIANQFNILIDTIRTSLYSGYRQELITKLFLEKEYAAIIVQDLYEPDLWWLQSPNISNFVAVILMALISSFSGWRLFYKRESD